MVQSSLVDRFITIKLSENNVITSHSQDADTPDQIECTRVLKRSLLLSFKMHARVRILL